MLCLLFKCRIKAEANRLAACDRCGGVFNQPGKCLEVSVKPLSRMYNGSLLFLLLFYFGELK